MIKLSPEQLKKLLIEQGLLKETQFDEIGKEAERLNQNIGDILVSRGILTNEYLYNLIATFLGVERANLGVRGINRDILHKVDEKFAKEKQLLAFSQDADGTINVAMEDPIDLQTIEFLEKKLSSKIRPFLAMPDDLAMGYATYGKELSSDFRKLIEDNVKISLQRRMSSDKEEDLASQVPVVDTVNNIFSYAISMRASDIHWEIFNENVLIRFRVDGILHEVMTMPKEIYPSITARIKLLGGLKIDEHRKPQDGRFRYVSGQEINDVRVSIIPTLYGEKIVLRLLPATQKPLSLTELGMFDDVRGIVEANIKKTYGMVLVTGPTGSGKTTTLYSILTMLNRPEVNIVTIEDPIEYNIKYVNQIQVNPAAGITFASGLRAILRQDPNIVMVGEIRDQETAEIAVNAALTGHLVLSTLHTNDAPSAIPRLIDMGIPPFLIAATLNVVIAQRLVRKVHLDCIKSYEPSTYVTETIKTQMAQFGIKDFETPKLLYQGKGCQADGNTGYKGRFGIYEIMEINDDLRKVMIDSGFTLGNLVNKAREKGMKTMFEDGLKKASLGLTTIEEVLRVIRE